MKISKTEFHSPELLCHCYMLILPRVSGKAGAGERAKFYVVLTRINYIKERERERFFNSVSNHLASNNG